MPAPIIFALSRHGDYEQPKDVPSAWLLHPLTPKGEEQALALGHTLREDARSEGWKMTSQWDSSVLLRAYQTATLAAKAWSEPLQETVRIQTTQALVERSVGSAANLTVGQIEEILDRDPRFDRPKPGWKSIPSFRLPVPGAESLLEAGLRVAQHLRQSARDIARASTGDTPRLRVVVGHGASLRWAAHALGVLTMEQAKGCSMHHARSVYIEWKGEDNWSHIGGEWKPRSRPAQD